MPTSKPSFNPLRWCLPMLRLSVLLSLAITLSLGLPQQFSALAEATPLPHPVQLAVTGNGALIAQATLPPDPTNRPGKRKVAEEVAQSSFEDEFGSFNLFIIFFVTLGPLKVIPVFMQVTRGARRALRRQLAFRSTAIATVRS